MFFFRFELESPESEKLTDSVSEKEEKEIDEAEEKVPGKAAKNQCH